MHISYFHGTKSAHVQVVGHERFTACMALLGFVLSVDDLPDELPKQEGISENTINGFEDKDSLAQYMLDSFGVQISKHGNIDTMKAKAIEHINSLPGGTNEGE